MIDLDQAAQRLHVRLGSIESPRGYHRQDLPRGIRVVLPTAAPRFDDIQPAIGRFEVGEVMVGLQPPSEVGKVVGVGKSLDVKCMCVGAAAAAGVKGTAGVQCQKSRDRGPPFSVRWDAREVHRIAAPLKVAPGADLGIHDSRRWPTREPREPSHLHLGQVRASVRAKSGPS